MRDPGTPLICYQLCDVQYIKIRSRKWNDKSEFDFRAKVHFIKDNNLESMYRDLVKYLPVQRLQLLLNYDKINGFYALNICVIQRKPPISFSSQYCFL